jgi:selenocysteine-specific translation elongation factor
MEIKERSITVGLLGANHEITKRIGEALGSPGQRSDLQYYNRLDTKIGLVFTGVAPIGYPDKIKTLIQACAQTQIHVMIIDAETGITAEIGEILVIMDIFTRCYNTHFIAVVGNVTTTNEWRIPDINKQLPTLLQKTALKDIEIVTLKKRADYDVLKEKLNVITNRIPKPNISEDVMSKVLLDHIFPVKGVGTVALGLVQKGQIEAGKMYDLMPVQNKVILRSIQKFDRDFKTAEAGDRVGLSLKGIKSDKLDRNTIFCSMDSMKKSDKATIKLWVSSYYRPTSEIGKISAKDPKNYFAIVDLAISTIRITDGDDISPGQSGELLIKLDKELVHEKSGMRGILADFEPFQKKSRIVGYFEQV